MAAKFKIPVHIEVQIKSTCNSSQTDVVKIVTEKLKTKCQIFQNGVIYIEELNSMVDLITVSDLLDGKKLSFWQSQLCIHAFRLSDQGPESDFLDGEEELSAAEQWELPNKLLVGLWDSIVIDIVIKNRLLSYCSSSIQFSDARIDSNIISWNRMVLLHGPPGTGKTTICKALAQKMFIRNSDRYSSGILLEVNSHSLFSKWFSESGKLVMKLFAHIGEIADDEDCLVVVLIDEIESITSARSSASKSNEPGDAVRVVNAVLTSLDQLKRRPNVLLLSTSNMMNTVDPAFLDRVDLKVFLGPPSVGARFNILHSCLLELMHKGIIQPAVSLSDDWKTASVAVLERCTAVTPSESSSSSSPHVAVQTYLDTVLQLPRLSGMDVTHGTAASDAEALEDTDSYLELFHRALGEMLPQQYLYIIAVIAEGMSGRTLRKLPIKAHSFFLQRPAVSLTDFLCAMHATITVERHSLGAKSRAGSAVVVEQQRQQSGNDAISM